MGKKIIVSTKLPVAGPYSIGVAAGGFIFISGQLPVDPNTGEIAGDIRVATRQVLENIKSVITAAGLTMADIVKTTVFLTNMNDFPAVNEIYSEYFPEAPPARSTVAVNSLPKGAPLEVEAIALQR
ncbi:MAG: reactive intermediate/imine deaminase [Deltaproteobacteria bacterium HGW-Deltaproteobacteria-12]|jgi:2-iminobutanoate/2-iminopropanoate deaminase|nr:MAG: reactive intermediate/imine deaminase [Deltaproteobacteria bacterium HGW-Deltaproteobacteria-12]